MNKLAQNQTAHPQTVEIPQPLEIHPSVNPELAKGLMAACEHISCHPEQFDMSAPGFDSEGKGCVICHVERLSNWRRDRTITHTIALSENEVYGWALGDWRRIFSPFGWNKDNCGHYAGYNYDESRFARIEHFLRTGE